MKIQQEDVNDDNDKNIHFLTFKKPLDKDIMQTILIFHYILDKMCLLAPTGALIVMICYFTDTVATFCDFEHCSQYI